MTSFPFDPDHDLNDGRTWSAADIADLRLCIADDMPVEEIAAFLCRAGTVEEVRAKIAKLDKD